MLQLHPSRRIRNLVLAVFVCAAAAVPGAVACFGWQVTEVWICLDPVTGKINGDFHDDSHYVGGVLDPCHCYDPCGPWISCPMLVDAGTLPPGCDAGAAGDGG